MSPARALVINPTVLLLDEAFSALDKNLRASMQVELREIQRKLGVTAIFVTHNQSEALSLSDRVAAMSGGAFASSEHRRKSTADLAADLLHPLSAIPMCYAAGLIA